jgi:hypothetical protein
MTDDEIGPMPAPVETVTTSEVCDAVREFRDREQRQRERMQQAQEMETLSSTQHPEWMVEMPESHGIESILSHPLRSRGFAQTTRRVQADGGVPGKIDEGTRRLWTERPQQREARMRLRDTDMWQDTSDLAQERISTRDAAIRERFHGEKKRSLMEEYQEIRRQRLREGKEHDHSEHKKDRAGARNHESRHRRHSDHHSRHHSVRHRHHSDRHRGHSERQKHHCEHRRKHTHVSYSDSAETSKPPRKTKSQIAEEELMNGYAAPLFDPTHIMGSSQLNYERNRSGTLANAAQLSSRFIGGTSGSFL